LVLDIGSNDGIALLPFKEKGIRAIGVEPANNIAYIANKNGFKTVNDYFNDNDKYHLQKQYIEGEELIITKYIRINENETYNIKLKDGRDYIIDPNKYSAPHHSVKTNNTEFCGDIPKDTINQNLPKSYKYFYDEEIKSLVDTFYKDDVEKYNFSFDNF